MFTTFATPDDATFTVRFQSDQLFSSFVPAMSRARFLKYSKWVTLSAALHATSGALEHAIRLAWQDMSRQELIPEFGYLYRVMKIGVAPARPILLCRSDGNYEVEVTVVGIWTSEKLAPDDSNEISWVPTEAELALMSNDEARRNSILSAIYDRPEEYAERASDFDLLELARTRAPQESDL